MFFWQVCSKMIARHIKSSLTPASWEVILGKRKHFTWMGSNGDAFYDRTTMLQLIISRVNPSTCVGISNLKSLIRTAWLVQMQWDIVAWCKKVNDNYLLIDALNMRHTNMMLDTYTALLLGSFNNEKMNENWEVRTNVLKMWWRTPPLNITI